MRLMTIQVVVRMDPITGHQQVEFDCDLEPEFPDPMLHVGVTAMQTASIMLASQLEQAGIEPPPHKE